MDIAPTISIAWCSVDRPATLRRIYIYDSGMDDRQWSTRHGLPSERRTRNRGGTVEHASDAWQPRDACHARHPSPTRRGCGHGTAHTATSVCGRSVGRRIVVRDQAAASRGSAGRSVVVAASEPPDSGRSEDGYERDACEVFLVDSHIWIKTGDINKPVSSVARPATHPLSSRPALIARWIY